MSRGSKPTSSSRSGCSGGDFDWEPALRKLDELNARVEDPTLWDKPDEAQAVMRERTRLSSQIDTVKALERELEDALGYAELADEEGDEASLEEARVQLRALKERAGRAELEALLSGEADSNDAYVEVNAGAGGTESQDWAQMLTRMYLRWAERAGFKAEVVDLLPGEEAGIKSATIEITGEYAYGYLKSEIGVHRLIRISPFDASKRRHTSFASVAVIPEVEDVEVVVKDEELRIDVYRSSGPGGQGVNTADSAVRITHLPSGIVVACQNERSQLRNRDTAMRILKSRLYQIYEKKQREELAELTGEKKEIAFGSQIRTYTFHPYQIIKDHRTGLEVGNVDAVMDGEIDAFIEAFLASGKSA